MSQKIKGVFLPNGLDTSAIPSNENKRANAYTAETYAKNLIEDKQEIKKNKYTISIAVIHQILNLNHTNYKVFQREPHEAKTYCGTKENQEKGLPQTFAQNT